MTAWWKGSKLDEAVIIGFAVFLFLAGIAFGAVGFYLLLLAAQCYR